MSEKKKEKRLKILENELSEDNSMSLAQRKKISIIFQRL